MKVPAGILKKPSQKSEAPKLLNPVQLPEASPEAIVEEKEEQGEEQNQPSTMRQIYDKATTYIG